MAPFDTASAEATTKLEPQYEDDRLDAYSKARNRLKKAAGAYYNCHGDIPNDVAHEYYNAQDAYLLTPAPIGWAAREKWTEAESAITAALEEGAAGRCNRREVVWLASLKADAMATLYDLEQQKRATEHFKERASRVAG